MKRYFTLARAMHYTLYTQRACTHTRARKRIAHNLQLTLHSVRTKNIGIYETLYFCHILAL